MDVTSPPASYTYSRVNDAHSVEHVQYFIVYIRGVLLFCYTCNCHCKVAKYFVFCMRGSRGGGGGGRGSEPPLRFLSYFYYYFLARSARQY